MIRSSRSKRPTPAEPPSAPASGTEVTALARGLETEGIQALYAAWLEVRLQRAAARLERQREQERLEVRADYLIKAVAAAREMPADRRRKGAKSKRTALARAGDPLAGLHLQARRELDLARATLSARQGAEEREHAAAESQIRRLLVERADRHLASHRPHLAVSVQPVGRERAILQVERPTDLDAILLVRLFSHRLPTRWGFFSDDAVEDLARGPARFYPDEGMADPWLSDAEAVDAEIDRARPFAPLRGQLPLRLPAAAFPRYRLVHHGPVAELESRRKGQPYDHLVPREDAERLTGYLLRLKLAGKIELELKVG